ncbi:MAG: homoserine O-acetyltransferase MetX [Dethiobacteria bacterium]
MGTLGELAYESQERYREFYGSANFQFAAPPYLFTLESGKKIGPININYETYGQLSPEGDNVILIAHALTGSARVGPAKETAGRSEPGWWEPLIGPGKAFDTEKYFIVCANVLGGCYGSTGPASIDPLTGNPYGLRFPVVTIRDMVRVQRELLRYLGVRRLLAVVGGSMGGMQALEWAVTYPKMMKGVISIAATGRFSPQGIAYNKAARKAIMNDPEWLNGRYYGRKFPVYGLSLARMIGMITYKSSEIMEKRFGRKLQERDCDLYAFRQRFAVESYLDYQGEKLVKRFDPNTYLYLTKAMDLHDLGRGYPSYRAALRRIATPVFLLGISSDILFYPEEVRGMAVDLRRSAVEATYDELKSPHGHDAFLIEFEKLTDYIREKLTYLEQ